MTVPFLMNCAHRDDAWCLDCVRLLGEENWKVKALNAELVDVVAGFVVPQMDSMDLGLQRQRYENRMNHARAVLAKARQS